MMDFMKINVPEGASQVIIDRKKLSGSKNIQEHERYINICTMEQAETPEAAAGSKPYLLFPNIHQKRKFTGFYISKCRGILRISLMVLTKTGWDEITHASVSRDFNTTTFLLNIPVGAVDICGQWDEEAQNTWVSDGTRKTISDFLGKPIQNADMKCHDVITCYHTYDINKLLDDNYEYKSGMTGIFADLDYMPIPEEAYDRSGYLLSNTLGNRAYVCILQKAGIPTVRMFKAENFKGRTILTEYRRIGLKDNIPLSFLNKSSLVYYEKGVLPGYLEKKMDECMKSWEKKRQCFHNIYALMYPPYEEIINCRNKNLAEYMKEQLDRHEGDTRSMLMEVFGNVTCNGKKMNHHFCVSEPLLEAILNMDAKYCGKTMKTIKRIFQNCPEYLMKVNRQQAEEITGLFGEDRLFRTGRLNGIAGIMQKLVELFGTQRHMEYAEWIQENISYPHLSGYVEMMYALRNHIHMDWKTYSDIKRMHNKIQQVYEGMEKEDDNGLSCFHEQWKGYLFEDDEFTIRYPNDVFDLQKEGERLHHCAAEFIKSVMCGNTTILFVRKKQEPEKPFYTMEVKDGYVRQCQGFANKPIEYGSSIFSFIERFCKEKNLIFSAWGVPHGPII